MFSVLQNATYRSLFLSQLVSLLGTGLATVALGLLAYDLAGSSAALVLGTALTVKMVAYVTIAPVAAAFANKFNRRKMLVFLDFVRAGVALCLPFVSEVWQIYVLIFLLQSASAGFTPTFQAAIPDVLQDEAEYTKALSLSRLAMDTESLLSPTIAALLLTVVSFNYLFWGTAFGFVASALLVLCVVIPSPIASSPRSISDRITRGISIYLRTPRLRGLLAVSWVAAATGSMVIVNTVIIVRGELSLPESAVALALAAFGAGSMIVAFLLPSILERIGDRTVMLTGACINTAGLVILALTTNFFGLHFEIIVIGWFFLAIGYSAILTPAGRLLARSAQADDRAAVFAAQFTLSHACWLVAYPVAGGLITFGGPTMAMIGLSVFALVGLVTAFVIWPSRDLDAVEHSHPELGPDHPHLQGEVTHKHRVIIDDLHPTYLIR